jgi:hypothetical protein
VLGKIHVFPLPDIEVFELIVSSLPHPDLVLLVIIKSPVDPIMLSFVQAPRCLQLQPLVNYVVEDVHERVLGQSVRYVIESELEGREPLGDLRAQWMRLLLILLEGRNELSVQTA